MVKPQLNPSLFITSFVENDQSSRNIHQMLQPKPELGLLLNSTLISLIFQAEEEVGTNRPGQFVEGWTSPDGLEDDAESQQRRRLQ